MSETLRVFLACAPGVEGLLEAELAPLAPASIESMAGGVELRAEPRTLYRALLELGLPISARLRLASFEARRFATLVREASALPWKRWLPPKASVEIRVRAKRSKLYHTAAIAERLHGVLGEALDATVAIARAEGGPEESFVLHVRLEDDRCTLSLDLVGEPMQRRGYRLQTGKAPLSEDLARALLLLSGWDQQTPLADPFCGAGTIAIEAAILARGLPPGAHRPFAIQRMPGFDAALWQQVREAALAAALPSLPFPIYAS
ncbi:MAG: hypothetical protein OEY14_15735, partial [Myxococcales bacterium]|nr:hypothetical protein [Myxococcales bacterium]